MRRERSVCGGGGEGGDGRLLGESVKKTSVQSIAKNVSSLEFLLRILLELLLVELCTTSVGLKRSSKRILKRNSKEDTFPAIGCNIFFEAVALELCFFFRDCKKKNQMFKR